MASLDSLATECGVLRLQKARSAEVQVSENHCPDTDELALAAVLQLQAGTRLWLESAESQVGADSFQLICQNNAALPVKIKITSAFLPWIKPVDLAQCNAWVDNRLVCNQAESDGVALLCAIAPKPNISSIRAIQLKTSLTMRSVKDQPTALSPEVLQKLGEYAKPSVTLCRKIFNNEEPITATWTIKAEGSVSGVSIAEGSVDKQFAACASEALETRRFPEMAKEQSVTYKF